MKKYQIFFRLFLRNSKIVRYHTSQDCDIELGSSVYVENDVHCCENDLTRARPVQV